MKLDTGEKRIRVYIVEDEIAVRRSLKGKIPWGQRGLVFMGEAQNAEEALEAVKQDPPDIILLDMRMPGMGGQAFLDILNEEYPDIQVIILSGYSDFEYVQHALKCGAVDYLLKPIIKEELMASLFRAADVIESNRQQESKEVEQRMLLHQSIPLLKRSLLNSLLQGGHADPDDTIRKLALLNVHLNFPWYALAVVRIIDFDRIKTYYGHNSSLVFFALDNVMQETANDFGSFVGFKSELRENEYLCLLGFGEKDGARGKMEDFFERTRENIAKYNKVHIHITVSALFDSLGKLPRTYSQMIRNWYRHGDPSSGILFLDDTETAAADPGKCWDEEEIRTLVKLLEQQDVKGMTNLVKQLFVRVGQKYLDAMPVFRSLTADIYRAAEEEIRRLSGQDEGGSLDRLPACHEWMAECETPDELMFRLIHLLGELGEKYGEGGGTKNVILQARKYIDRHFYEDITLDSLANRFYMNRTYFSELFSQETGCSFKKYLNQVRVEKAKELLLQQDMKAANVALLVGFNDPVYFSNVFKKYTGMTITEYVERHRK